MKKVVDYTIIADSVYSLFVDEVQEKIADGWEPLGGAQVVASAAGRNNSGSPYFYSQTMVKRKQRVNHDGLLVKGPYESQNTHP